MYQIFFLNCVLFPQSDKLPRRYFYQEEEEHDRLSEATEIIFYELPKLEARLKDFLEGKTGVENLRKEEKWCMFMKYRHEEEAGELIDELCRKEAGIMRAEKAVTRISRDYIRYAKKMAGIKNSMDRAEELLLAREEAEKKGRAEGIQQGIYEIARKMKNAGRPLNEIEEFTGLPLDTIEKLDEPINN